MLLPQLAYTHSVVLPFVQAWSTFGHNIDDHSALRSFAESEYDPRFKTKVPETTAHLLSDYSQLLHQLQGILQREGSPLLLSDFRRKWHGTADKALQQLSELHDQAISKAAQVEDVKSYSSLTESILLFADAIEDTQRKFWQVEIGIRIALGIDIGDEDTYWASPKQATQK